MEKYYWLNNKQTIVFRHRSAIELIKKIKIDIFLDIWSWDGFFISLLKKETWIKWYWFELNSYGIKKANKKGIKTSQVDILNVKLINNHNKTYDLVTILDVLEHLLAPKKALENIYKLTNKYLILSVPNFNSITSRFQVLLWKIPENNTERKGHCYWFNKKVLEKLLNDTWFEIIEWKYNTIFNNNFIFKFLLKNFPSLFALSFTLLCEKKNM